MTWKQDMDTTARTLYGEARNQGWTGLVAVAWVIRNRAEHPGWWGGPSWHSICRKKFQFSCWNSDDANFAILPGLGPAENLRFRDAMAAALAVATGLEPDPTGGATHYHANYIDPPIWSRAMTKTARIGAHIFYKEEPDPPG